MGIDKKILEEIERYKSINNYIMEQVPPPPGELPPVPGGEELPPVPGGETPPPAGDMGVTPEAPAPEPGVPVDIENDSDVEEIDTEETTGDSGEVEEGGEETLDITDLVDTQKNMSDKQEEYFNNLFSQLSTLESKLGEMDQLVTKINSLEAKIDQFKPKTPQEKLELRSLDSGPFKQKLSDFFQDKQEEMRQSGKNEYVLTSDEVEDYSPEQVKSSFQNYDDENNTMN
jgi:hypothetical protein